MTRAAGAPGTAGGGYRACAGCDAPCGCPLTTPAAEPTDGLREAIADALEAMLTGATGIATRGYWLRRADALLAGPLADLLAKLQAVEALAKKLESRPSTPDRIGVPADYEDGLNDGAEIGYEGAARLIRRALAGQHTTDEEADRG